MSRSKRFVFEHEMASNNCTILWTIRNLTMFDSGLKSPKFSTGFDEEWHLELSTNAKAKVARCRLNCHLVGNQSSNLEARSEIGVLINGRKYFTQCVIIGSCADRTRHALWRYLKHQLLEFLKQEGIEKNDDYEMTLLCDLKVWKKDEIKVISHFEEETEPTHTEENSEPAHCLVHHVTKQWRNQAFTDVTLEVDGKVFKCHKVILAALSPVFEAMFQEGTKEPEENHVVFEGSDGDSDVFVANEEMTKRNDHFTIEDIDSVVFDAFLHYVYTGEALHLDEIVTELFATADKYCVRPLAEMCIKHMSKNISVDNAIEILILVDRYSMVHSKAVVVDFVRNHFFDVVLTENWEILRKTCPELAKELTSTMQKKE